MRPKVLWYSAIGLILVMWLLLSVVAATHWSDVKTSFFQIRLVEFLTATSPWATAFLVAIVVNKAMTNEQRKRDMLDRQLERLQERVAGLLALAHNYADAKESPLERQIIKEFKALSTLLYVISSAAKRDCGFKPGDLFHQDFLAFKRSVTGSASGFAAAGYGPEQVAEIERAHERFMNSSFECRMRLYSS